MFDFNNASEDDLKREYKRIAAQSGDHGFGTKKELKHLSQMLMDREQVLAFSSGFMDGNTWLIVLTDRRILFLDKGMLWGLKEVSIPLDRIQGVSGKTGLIMGKITINDRFAARQFEQVSKGAVRPFINRLQQEIGANRPDSG